MAAGSVHGTLSQQRNLVGLSKLQTYMPFVPQPASRYSSHRYNMARIYVQRYSLKILEIAKKKNLKTT